MTPKSGLYMSFQIAPMTMPGMQDRQQEDGAVDDAAAHDAAREQGEEEPEHHLRATRRDTANSAVFTRPSRNSWSRGSSAKCSSPANAHCAAPCSQRMSCTDITSRFAIGSSVSAR